MSDLIDRQKAKDAIDMALDHIDHVPPWVYDNLLNALNEVPSVKPTPSKALGALDCVDRQAAMKIRFSSGFDHDGILFIPYRDVEEHLKKLPSAQPEQELLKDGTLVVKTNFDMTKFDRVNVIQNGTHYGDLFYRDDDTRRNGKWIGYKADDKDWQRDDGSPVFMNCSECHEAVINNGSAHWNFCPNCGCRMEEGDAE